LKKYPDLFLVTVCLWMVSFSPPAFSQETYKFELMWPKLEQPWYFRSPTGLAVDSSGNIYIADTDNCQIQKFDSNGTFIAKWGSQGSGDDQLIDPTGVAVDASGYVYVADHDRIKKFDSNGTFIAKWGSEGDGDGQFFYRIGVAVDPSGEVYVADSGNHRIQKFDSNGNFITKWGSWGSKSGQFASPGGIAVDSSENVYVADTLNHRIQRFDSSGNFIGKWGSRGSAGGQFEYPSAVAVDSLRNVYVADIHHIQKFNSNGNLIAQWSYEGTGYGWSSDHPLGVAVDSFGNVYVAGGYSDRVQKFDSNGNIIAKWCSYGTGDGQFYNPRGVALDSSENVYVADGRNSRIQKFDSSGNFVAKWGDYGTADGQFFSPYNVAVDGSGNVFVVDQNNRIQKFDSSGSFITKWTAGIYGNSYVGGMAIDSFGKVYVTNANMCVVGLCRYTYSVSKFDSNGNFITEWGSSGTGDGELSQPSGVAADLLGYLYVADAGNHRIQKFDSSGNFVAKWGSEGDGDGQFHAPTGVTVDSSGYVYVADTWYGGRIQKFDSNGNFITKWGSYGSEEGQFKWIYGVAADASGNVYVADHLNNRIQKFSPVGQEIISAPTIPSGPGNGLVGSKYTFSTGGSSSDLGHPVQYRFSWGDGTYSDWSASPAASKSWPSPSSYSVKAQTRCSIDTSIGSSWSAGLTVNITSTIILESPVKDYHFSTCSLYSLPVFSWSASETFNGYQVQFSPGSSFGTVAVSVPASGTGIAMPLDNWKTIMLIQGPSGGTVYWRVVGTRANGTTQKSEVGSIVIDSLQPAGNPTIAPTVRRPKPILTWRTNCNTKFKAVFGSDSGFTKKTYSIEIANPAGGDFTAFKTLSSLQWMKIKLLVKNKSGSTIYWYIESWDELGRQAKTNVMSFVLTD
jgi:tripartite motif-containing protein 71